jgi:hypothetical protein
MTRRAKRRQPPSPDSMKRPAVKGTCRWCGEPILKPDGTPATVTWHRACVLIYRIACFSGDQRRAVFNRDNGICAECGTDTLAGLRKPHPHTSYHSYRRMGRLWHVDHTKPLYEANGRIEYFLLENMRTLCAPCHAAKTKAEAAARAVARRQSSSSSSSSSFPDIEPSNISAAMRSASRAESP